MPESDKNYDYNEILKNAYKDIQNENDSCVLAQKLHSYILDLNQSHDKYWPRPCYKDWCGPLTPHRYRIRKIIKELEKQQMPYEGQCKRVSELKRKSKINILRQFEYDSSNTCYNTELNRIKMNFLKSNPCEGVTILEDGIKEFQQLHDSYWPRPWPYTPHRSRIREIIECFKTTLKDEKLSCEQFEQNEKKRTADEEERAKHETSILEWNKKGTLKVIGNLLEETKKMAINELVNISINKLNRIIFNYNNNND